MSEVANSRIRNLLKPIIELLSGIPSVVYGFFGLIVIVPFIQKVFNLPVGESGLAGSIVLAIMALLSPCHAGSQPCIGGFTMADHI